MEVIFTKAYLQELYMFGRSQNKKHTFQPNIVLRYKQAIDKLRAARHVEELYVIRSLRYKKLSGDKSGISSVRVNDQYRIEFIISKKGMLQILRILELSNHYT